MSMLTIMALQSAAQDARDEYLGTVIGFIVGLALVIGLFVWWRKRRH